MPAPPLLRGSPPRTSTPGGRGRHVRVVSGFGSVLLAFGLLTGAHALGTLKQGGTLVHVGGIWGTDTLVILCLAVAWLMFLAAAIILMPAAARQVTGQWLRRSLTTLLWTGATAWLLGLALFAGWTVITADSAYHEASSPDGQHRLLIVNSSVLLLGSFEVYLPSCGSGREHVADLSTDDGYDPFAAGQYAVQWSASSATLSYVADYLDPGIRENVTVPVNITDQCR